MTGEASGAGRALVPRPGSGERGDTAPTGRGTQATLPSQALILFGASGDLAARKVIPALYTLALGGLLPPRFAVVGYGRTAWDTQAFRAHARRAVEASSPAPVDERAWRALSDALLYVSGPLGVAPAFSSLRARLGELERGFGPLAPMFLCATPPSTFPAIISGLVESRLHEGGRIIIEKPFGSDGADADRLNALLHEVFDESDVFRIDHYLGKEMVQNILLYRFANPLFERSWDREAIDHVQITAAESIGVEGRASYYEEAGATKDVLQNHLLQVLSLIAMEAPRSLEPEAIRDAKVKLLRAVRPLEASEVVKGQYLAGDVGGRPVLGYREEAGVDPRSRIDTFVAARAWIDDPRWAGVPFLLRTGKRLARRATEITVVFRETSNHLFQGLPAPSAGTNHLHISIQPDQQVSFVLRAKQTGMGFNTEPVHMQVAHEEAFAGAGSGYERLLHDAMAGDHTLFPREDEVRRSWEIVAPVLGTESPILPYRAGTWGPDAADRLIFPRSWHLREPGRDKSFDSAVSVAGTAA